ncbi:unnamed protein product [Linum trigynum]|uniref:Uncharacterized protein n=1 Tax=Linum trigynum TaxID=586398 RepID=A0AAV2GA71_9ROSI
MRRGHEGILQPMAAARRAAENPKQPCMPSETAHLRGVFGQVYLKMNQRDFYGKSLEDWMFYYSTGRGRAVYATLFAGTCWLLWKNRNNFCFKSELQSFAQIQFHSAQLRQSIIPALEKETIVGGAGGLHTPTPICWQQSGPGWTCLNTDGSVYHSPSSTAAGGIVRGDDGRFIIAFTMNLGGGGVRSPVPS